MLLEHPKSRFEEIYKVYEEAFPAIERRTKKGQEEVFDSLAYQVRIIEEQGEVLAFLGYWELPGCVFLEHLATLEKSRGKGFGKQLVEEVLKETAKPVFLEIEPVTKDDPMTERRAGFYQRLGFHLNPFYYQQMPLKPEDNPIRLMIMSYGTPFTKEEFLPYKKEIYHFVYGVEASL